ncbi:MAG: dissimilatory sulfite reductase-asociated protein DsvD [Deltaproteobacteria bacterium]|nr:dissimilatory sulfite reductase-asociated protein DsvD [Deltaproteobacteria bacterium]
MGAEEDKKLIIETLQGKKLKTKFYLKDFNNMFPDRSPREVSKLVNKMVAEGLLEYWSTGSTTMIGLKGAGIQHETEDSKE